MAAASPKNDWDNPSMVKYFFPSILFSEKVLTYLGFLSLANISPESQQSA